MLTALLFACASGWLTILCLSVYAHRSIAHRSLTLHPAVAHAMRFWLWLTTGASTRAWVAVHRKHHALVDRPGDPHSPVVFGLGRILFLGYFYYRREARDPQTVERFGKDCPDDWLERHVYVPLDLLGLAVVLAADVLLFGWGAGLLAFAVQMSWEAFWAAGVINGLGHAVGYRSFESRDSSRNIVPVGVIVSGEELHNNHHRFPRSARFSARRYEIDVGWWLIRGLAALGLARDLYVFDRPLAEHRVERAEGRMHALLVRWREKVVRLEAAGHASLAERRRALDKLWRTFSRRLERYRDRFQHDARARLEALRQQILEQMRAAFARLGEGMAPP
jgi:stearoyl-CoA desaturase (delta-9 desaturase)